MKRLIWCSVFLMLIPSAELSARKRPGKKTSAKQNKKQGFGVLFTTSMATSNSKKTSNKKNNRQKNSADLKLYEKLYTQHIVHGQYSNAPRIPKIIHQIWLGSPFPDKYRGFQQTWLAQHPGWRYMLWTDKEVEAFGLQNKQLYDKARNYGEKSDIVRYEILYRYGGLYIDTDFECLKPFDIFHHYCDFYMGIIDNGIPQNGLIGSVARHPILKECIDSLTISTQGGASATLNATGPFHLQRCFKAHAHKGICVGFPARYFYPWPATQRHKNNPSLIARWIKPESYAIHYWEVSWNGGVFRRRN